MGTHFHGSLQKHEKICTNKTKYVYPGGFCKAQQTIFEKLEVCIEFRVDDTDGFGMTRYVTAQRDGNGHVLSGIL
jgi:hypothetical protein